MKKHIYRLVLCLLFISTLLFSLFWFYIPDVAKNYQQTQIPKELVGKVFHWKYNIGWDFRVKINEDSLSWEGVGGSFEGMRETVSPHITVVSEGIYFFTWNISFFGYDSVIVDLEKSLVFAHSKANSNLFLISGKIYCNGMFQKCSSPKL